MNSRVEPLLLGIDLGTSAIKGSVHRLDGSVLATASVEYPLLSPGLGQVEVALTTYWDSFRSVIHSLLRSCGNDGVRIASIGISAQGETLVVVGADGQPLRNAIVWLDNRAIVESTELDNRFGADVIYGVTGQPGMNPAWPAAKILWLRNHEPEIFARAHKFLLLEDYFIARLSGHYVCEGSLATSTCYWDFRQKRWWTEMLAALSISKDQLPTLVEPGTAIGKILPQVAAELGLSEEIVVCTGALDQACGAIGVGNVGSGILSENTGTAVALCATLDGARLDPQLRMPCHYHGIPDSYMFHTFTSGGLLLKWFRNEFYKTEFESARASGLDVYDLIGEEAAQAPAGSNGLIALPHLQGAMAPDANPAARGAFIGLTLEHGRGHVSRAILESVAFVIRRNVEVMEELGVKVDSIRASGGGSRSRLWKQIEADVTKRPVILTEQSDAATLGACILAGTGVGLYSSIVEAAEAMVHLTDTFEPNSVNSQCYDDSYGAYLEATTALAPLFTTLSANHE